MEEALCLAREAPHPPWRGDRDPEAPLLVYFPCSACRTFPGCGRDGLGLVGKVISLRMLQEGGDPDQVKIDPRP